MIILILFFSNSRIVFENDINTGNTSTFVEIDDGQHDTSFDHDEEEDQDQDAANSKE